MEMVMTWMLRNNMIMESMQQIQLSNQAVSNLPRRIGFHELADAVHARAEELGVMPPAESYWGFNTTEHGAASPNPADRAGPPFGCREPRRSSSRSSACIDTTRPPAAFSTRFRFFRASTTPLLVKSPNRSTA